jgi:hypothetical protein
MAATLTSPRAQITPGGRSFVREVRPVVDTNAATLRIGTAERMQDGLTYWGVRNLGPDGEIQRSLQRADARV